MRGPLAPALAARLRALPAGPKLLALMCAATALLLTRSPWPLAAAALLALGLALLPSGPDGSRPPRPGRWPWPSAGSPSSPSPSRARLRDWPCCSASWR